MLTKLADFSKIVQFGKIWFEKEANPLGVESPLLTKMTRRSKTVNIGAEARGSKNSKSAKNVKGAEAAGAKNARGSKDSDGAAEAAGAKNTRGPKDSKGAEAAEVKGVEGCRFFYEQRTPKYRRPLKFYCETGFLQSRFHIARAIVVMPHCYRAAIVVMRQLLLCVMRQLLLCIMRQLLLRRPSAGLIGPLGCRRFHIARAIVVMPLLC
jgi:hypothetical protein